MKQNKNRSTVWVCFMLISAIIALSVSCGKSDEGYLTAVSREDGSGTRAAFTEIFGIETLDEKGNKIDATSDLSEVTNSTSVMITTVKLNKNAIGYISLGTMNEDVKPVMVDSTAPSAENIKNGSYRAVRSFAIVTMKGKNPSSLEKDFTDFIMSEKGQSIIEEKGYVGITDKDEEKKQAGTGNKSGTSFSGHITISGSSSVTPVMEALKEEYIKINPNAEIEVQQSDSTQGIMAVREGICDIGMTSRSLSEGEIKAGLAFSEIARDGIVIIVNKDNPVSNLTSDEIKKIYTGEIINWNEIGMMSNE